MSFFCERGYTGVDAPHHSIRALALVSNAALTSTGGERSRQKPIRPLSLSSRVSTSTLPGGQVFAVPSQAQLLTFAACFGGNVVAFVAANRRIPTCGEVGKSVDMSLALDAFMTGVFMTDDEGTATDVIAAADLVCDSDLCASRRSCRATSARRSSTLCSSPSPADALR